MYSKGHLSAYVVFSGSCEHLLVLQVPESGEVPEPPTLQTTTTEYWLNVLHDYAAPTEAGLPAIPRMIGKAGSPFAWCDGAWEQD